MSGQRWYRKEENDARHAYEHLTCPVPNTSACRQSMQLVRYAAPWPLPTQPHLCSNPSPRTCMVSAKLNLSL